MPEKRITIQITVDCANEEQHLAVSSYLKTIMQLLDQSIEAKAAGNDFVAVASGYHLAAETKIPGEHPLSKLL